MKRGFWLTLIVMLILPPNSATAQSCSATLTDSGPLEIRENGRIVENLRITSTNGDVIRIVNATDVIIRNVEIFHAGGAGIRIQNADRTQVDNVSITNTGAPPFGENPSIDLLNIFINESSGVRISRARLWRGSSGILFQFSRCSHVLDRGMISAAPSHEDNWSSSVSAIAEYWRTLRWKIQKILHIQRTI